MKYIDEYRDKERVKALAKAIRKAASRPWHIMEICGGQTHAIARYRLEELLPKEITLLHGPGCPVCVTPEAVIDYALTLAMQPDVILASFGDMMRVPGSRDSLMDVKARGGNVRMLYSPLDAVALAAAHPDKQVVFFAIGFETTVPVHLTALKEAQRRGLENFRLLPAFFTVPPVMDALLSDPESEIDGFLLAGHVCAITGYAQYRPLAEKYRVPMVVTGFEPVDLLYGIYRCLLQLEAGTCTVENAYKRAVPEEGNPQARALIKEMLMPCDQEWRGIGVIKDSGLKIKNEELKMKNCCSSDKTILSSNPCIAGAIMKGHKQVADCPHFGTGCTPSHPMGAPMVSSEGVCAAYYTYKS